MFVAWIAFPLLLAALTVGAGLLVERACGDRLPGPLLPSLGLALIIVVVHAATRFQLGAALAAPLVLVLAATGFALGWRRIQSVRLDGWAVAVAVATFATLSAPVVLSGEATFLGHLINNDSAFWFVLIDWVFDHGRVVPTGTPDAYEWIARTYLETSSPLGAHMPLGVGRALLGGDVAWLFAPYLAFMLALTALGLYALAQAVQPASLRALVAFVPSVSGLVYAYFASQGAIKEIAMLWALVLAVAVAVATLPRLPGLRALVPTALVLAAGFYVLNMAALPWIGLAAAVLGGVLIWRLRHAGWRAAAPYLAAAAALIALALTSLGSIRDFVSAVAYLSEGEDLGILVAPLSKWQILGIWPQADFRFTLDEHARVGYAAIGLAFAAFALGALWIARRRPLGPLLLLASAGIASAYLVSRGSPYADAKVYMIASAVVVFTAMLGAASLSQAGRRLEGWLLALALASTVIWTDTVIADGARLAPHDRYEEMATAGERLAGQGPTLSTESDEYIAYFLRDAEPIGGFYGPTGSPHELRPGAPSAEAHAQLARIPSYDLDELQLDYLQQHAAIVRPRIPTASRPPANYERTWVGEYYEIWQRDENRDVEVLRHLPLGEGPQPAARAPCRTLRAFADRTAETGGRIAYVVRPEKLRFVAPDRVAELCGRRLDWVESVVP